MSRSRKKLPVKAKKRLYFVDNPNIKELSVLEDGRKQSGRSIRKVVKSESSDFQDGCRMGERGDDAAFLGCRRACGGH